MWINHLRQLRNKKDFFLPDAPIIVIKNLNNRKSAAKDGIQNELLRYGGTKLILE